MTAVETPRNPDRPRPASGARTMTFTLSRRERLLRLLSARDRLLQLLLLAALLAAWEYFGRKAPDYTFAPLSSVVPAGREMLESGELPSAVADSIAALLIGLALAVVVGNALGFVMGWWRTFGRTLDPFLAAIYVLPIVALIPLIIVWVGIGLMATVVVVFLFAVFEITINAQAGVRSVEPALIDVARSFGGGKLAVATRILLPASLPFVFVGLRIGVIRALKGMVVAEMLIAVSGLGELIVKYAAAFQMDRVLVGIVTIALMGVSLYGAVAVAERRALRWR